MCGPETAASPEARPLCVKKLLCSLPMCIVSHEPQAHLLSLALFILLKTLAHVGIDNWCCRFEKGECLWCGMEHLLMVPIDS
jgi:hypothetical protein